MHTYWQNCTLTNLSFAVSFLLIILACLIHFFPYAFLVLYFDRVLLPDLVFFIGLYEICDFVLLYVLTGFKPESTHLMRIQRLRKVLRIAQQALQLDFVVVFVEEVKLGEVIVGILFYFNLLAIFPSPFPLF